VLFTGIFFGLISAVTAIIISPLQFLKVIKQQVGGYYYIIFKTTVNRSGFSTFFRGAVPYAVMNFLSSMAFGFSEYLSVYILGVTKFPILISVIVRSFLGGIIETGFSIKSELSEISKNKGSLIKEKPKIITIAAPILLRNIIFWHGSIIAYEISESFYLSIVASSVISFIFGAMFALISIPFDVIATQNCGAKEDRGLIGRLRKILKNRNQIFAGNVMRVIQVAIFTLTTVLTLFLFKRMNLFGLV